ncbi:MAG: hypothetical protein AAB339_00975 [Elusimicrobiota bacterium]
MNDGDIREMEWLKREVALASRLSDEDRGRILSDLWETAAAIRRSKSPEDIRRDEAARRTLDAPGLARYRELAERLE